MNQTGSYVSISRSKLGPEPDKPAHGLRYVERARGRYVATCFCGFSKKRRTASIARLGLQAHIAEGNGTVPIVAPSE